MLPAADRSPEKWRPSGISGLFLCDVASFGHPSRTDAIQGHIRAALYRSVRHSFDASVVPFDRCYAEDRGDGIMVAVPPDVATSVLLTSLIDHLCAEVRHHNDVSSEPAQVRLRVAIHSGTVEWDGNGLVGKALNDGFRLLDAPALKEVLGDSGAAVAVIVSQRVYEDEVRPGKGLIDPGDYHLVEVAVKEMRTTAWIRVPGGRLPEPVSSGALATTALEPKRPSAPTPLPSEDLNTLLNHFLEIREMRVEGSREGVVSALPSAIAQRIPRAPDARLDTYNIIMTCLEHSGGLEDLLHAIKIFAGDSIPVLRLEDLIARMLQRP